VVLEPSEVEAAASKGEVKASPRSGVLGLTPQRMVEMRGFAAEVVARLGERMPARVGRVITVAAPVSVLVLFLLLMLVASPGWSGFLRVVATLALSLVLGVVGLVLAARRRVAKPGEAPTPQGVAGLSTVSRVWLAVAAVALLAVSGIVSGLFASVGQRDRTDAASAAAGVASASAAPAPTASASSPVPDIDRKDEVFAGGLVLHIPASFRPSTAAPNLLIHFSGNTKVVEDSVAAAGVDTIVVVANLGQGSGPYMERFGAPASFPKLIEQIDARLAKRGLTKTGRVALSSFGSGYGALLQILSSEPNIARIDALLVMEGLYAGYIDKQKKVVDPLRIEPYVRFAKLAKDDKKLFVVTHSELQAEDYAGTKAVCDAILVQLKGERQKANSETDSPAKVELPSVAGLFGGKPPVSLAATSTAHLGGFVVLGYAGDSAQHHIAHLAQMSVTALPLLAQRWK
jgi:hypothetical protein